MDPFPTQFLATVSKQAAHDSAVGASGAMAQSDKFPLVIKGGCEL